MQYYDSDICQFLLLITNNVESLVSCLECLLDVKRQLVFYLPLNGQKFPECLRKKYHYSKYMYNKKSFAIFMVNYAACYKCELLFINLHLLCTKNSKTVTQICIVNPWEQYLYYDGVGGYFALFRPHIYLFTKKIQLKV